MPSYELVSIPKDGSEPESILTLDVTTAVDPLFRAGARDALLRFALRQSRGARLPGLPACPLVVTASRDPLHPVGEVFPSTAAASRAISGSSNLIATAFGSLKLEEVTVKGATLKKK